MVQGMVSFCLVVCLLFFIQSCAKDTSTNPDDNGETGSGSLFINSTPQGYQIFLDEVNSGKITPDTIRYLAIGTHQVNLQSQIYCDTTFTINITESQLTSLEIDLTQSARFYGKIECTSSPGNCLIFLDDSNTVTYTPNTITNIYPGEHKIEFRKDGYLSYDRDITVNSEETKLVQGILQDTTTWRLYNTSNSEIVSNDLTCIECNINSDRAIWIGSRDNGVALFNNGDWSYYNTGNSPLPSNNITCVENDGKGYMWIGTDNGLAIYKGETWDVFNNADSVFIDNYITDISCHAAPLGIHVQTYIGTRNGGLVYYHYEYGWYNFNVSNSTFPSNTVNSVWSGTISAFYFSGTENGLWQGFVEFPRMSLRDNIYTTDNSELTSNNIDLVSRTDGSSDSWAVINDPDGCEVFIYSGSSLNYLNYTATLSYNFAINTIYQHPTGTTWLGTNEGAVFIEDFNIERTINTTNSVLVSNNITGAYVDIDNNLWLATDNGLVKYKQ